MLKSSYILLAFFFISSFIFGQINIPEIKNAVLPISSFKVPAVSELLKKSKIMIMYRTYSSSGRKPFDIISYQNDNRWHAYYLSDSSRFHDVFSYNFLDSVSVSQEFVSSIWETMISENIFVLPADREDEKECDYTIHDAIHYEVKILTPKEYKYLDYYAPDRYEQQCPGNISRQKILKLIAVFAKANFISRKV